MEGTSLILHLTAFLLTQDQQGEVSVMMSLTRFKDWAAAWTA